MEVGGVCMSEHHPALFNAYHITCLLLLFQSPDKGSYPNGGSGAFIFFFFIVFMICIALYLFSRV
jgi:hypothetical protein